VNGIEAGTLSLLRFFLVSERNEESKKDYVKKYWKFYLSYPE